MRVVSAQKTPDWYSKFSAVSRAKNFDKSFLFIVIPRLVRGIHVLDTGLDMDHPNKSGDDKGK